MIGKEEAPAIITAVVEGALDLGMVKWDQNAIAANSASSRAKPFRGSTDLSRLIVGLGGYLAWGFGKGMAEDIGEGAALSATPLLMHSIFNALQKTPQPPQVREFVAHKAGDRLPAGRTYEKEFQTVSQL